MNAEVFAMGLEKCRLLTRLLGQNVENLDDYGCPKLQGIIVPRRKQRCMENGLCNICKFLYAFIVFVCTTNLFLSTRHDFSIALVLRN